MEFKFNIGDVVEHKCYDRTCLPGVWGGPSQPKFFVLLRSHSQDTGGSGNNYNVRSCSPNGAVSGQTLMLFEEELRLSEPFKPEQRPKGE